MGLVIGMLHVRRSIMINASAERIWEEFESFERIKAWLGDGQTIHEFDPQNGGNIDISVDIDGQARHFGGPVLICNRPRELSLESNWQAPHAWPVPTFWTFRLTPMYDSTMVELFHHGFERLGGEAADLIEGYEQGWGVTHLTNLRSIVETRP
jgi:uncharacterized protein YndB with AHSA1/START domain